MRRDDLADYFNTLFPLCEDFAPNGLQIEGCAHITHIAGAVSANQETLERAIAIGAQALVVHHGFFWKKEDPCLRGLHKKRLATCLQGDLSLWGWHLPLDIHPQLGNNVMLAQALGFEKAQASADPLLWYADVALSLDDLHKRLSQALQRSPQILSFGPEKIERIAWITGAGQDYIHQAVALGADTFLTGEISERHYALAQEYAINFIVAGHYATERFGIQALLAHVQQTFGLQVTFIEQDNPV